jgi:hypothetical protein
VAELKTRKNDQSVEAFLNSVPDATKRADSFAILELMRQATEAEPKMWGDTIVGFGEYRYKYASGREGDWFLAGFSPRKQNLTLYIVGGFEPYEELMRKLGRYKTGKGCLYINKLADVDQDVLRQLIESAIANPPSHDAA